MRDQGLRTGSTITTSGGRTRRWANSRRQPMPPISPQHAIGCATPTSSADRMLLHPRPTAQNLICSLKTGPFRIRVFRGNFPWLGGAEDDESLEVFGRAKGVHSPA